MTVLTIPFGKLLPDQAGFRNPGVLTAKNVVPQAGSYGPFRDLVSISNALSGRCWGAITARGTDGIPYLYAGDSSKLYEMIGSTLSDQSLAGGYTLADDDVWEFVVWNRNNKVIATNYTNAVQSLTIGNGAGANFANMISSTNKPKAKHIAIVGQFVVLGFTNDSSDGVRPSRLWWSGLGDETDFDPDAATQSDYEDLPTGGDVQRVVGGTEYGLVFQNDMVRTMRYVGSGTIFDILPIEYAPGTPIPNSVISHKGRVFYIAEDGFFGVTGGQVQPIGSAQVDKFFWDQFDISNKRSVSAAIDPIRKLVCWAFPGEGAAADLPNKLLMYKYDEDKWAEGDAAVEIILRTETQGYSLEELDNIGTNIDDAGVFSVSLDAERWRSGSIRFGAFDQLHKLSFFTGANKAGTIIPGDLQPASGRRWQLNGIRPLVDGGAVDVSVAPRTRLKDAVSFTTSTAMNADGLCPVRTEGRYQRPRFSLTSSTSWSHFQGFEIDFELDGEA